MSTAATNAMTSPAPTFRARDFSLSDHTIESHYLALSCEDDNYQFHFWIDQVTHAPRNDVLYRITKPAAGDDGQRLIVKELRRSAKAHAVLVAEMFYAIDHFDLPGQRQQRLAAAAAAQEVVQAAAEQKRRLEQEAMSVHEETGQSPGELRDTLRALQAQLHRAKQLLESAAAADRGLDASTTRAAYRLLHGEGAT